MRDLAKNVFGIAISRSCAKNQGRHGMTRLRTTRGMLTTLLFLASHAAATAQDAGGEGELQQRFHEAYHAATVLSGELSVFMDQSPWLGPAQREARLRKIERIANETEAINEELRSMNTAVRDRLEESFASLPVAEVAGFRIAIRHKPFLDEMPDNLSITVEGQTTLIAKPGGPEIYHVCPDLVMGDGSLAVIRFRLTTLGTRGGTPVPYFGVRDEEGNERVLTSFGSYPDRSKTHEVRVWVKGGKAGASQDGQAAFKTKQIHGTPGTIREELSENVYLFFHMNDTSSIVLEEIRVGQYEPPMLSPPADPSHWRPTPCFPRLRRLFRWR
jgi:hypothetical protein